VPHRHKKLTELSKSSPTNYLERRDVDRKSYKVCQKANPVKFPAGIGRCVGGRKSGHPRVLCFIKSHIVPIVKVFFWTVGPLEEIGGFRMPTKDLVLPQQAVATSHAQEEGDRVSEEE
jgi:hypothetical protein